MAVRPSPLGLKLDRLHRSSLRKFWQRGAGRFLGGDSLHCYPLESRLLYSGDLGRLLCQ